jgi:hypothetical protein
MDMQKPPTGLRAGGKRIWAALADRYTWEEHEFPLLHEVARLVDRLDELDHMIRELGVLTPSNHITPALVEARQQQVTLAKLLNALHIPATEAGKPNISDLARHAASVRWKGRAHAS